ncbi:MAG: GHKL domain-containing protein, partial [Clostridia bacterium]|nr:GHKL domain-containing protein [Clostridia bacterium]
SAKKIKKPFKVALPMYANLLSSRQLVQPNLYEVAELATAFNNMAGSLEKLEENRSAFLSNVSHDLRTPMTTISGFIDGILSGAIPEEKTSYYLEIVQSEVKRLARLVNTLLDVTRLESGSRKYNKTQFDICELARQVLISFESLIEDKNLSVTFECDDDNMLVFADSDAIHQVLYNLIDNAVKFTTVNGSLSLKVHSTDKKTVVSVYNSGKGISAEDIPRVFDRFYKTDRSRGLDKKGVGLGLYISKTIIDQHGEEMWVKSEEGSYCEFAFTLEKKYR